MRMKAEPPRVPRQPFSEEEAEAAAGLLVAVCLVWVIAIACLAWLLWRWVRG